jgi:hypothetical protein
MVNHGKRAATVVNGNAGWIAPVGGVECAHAAFTDGGKPRDRTTTKEQLMVQKIPQVGAPDPELRNSPILDDEDEELATELEVETGVCYFNSVAYALGAYEMRGSELLHCEERGVWVRSGEMRPG